MAGSRDARPESEATVGEQLLNGAEQAVDAIKPKLRGWLHAGMTPLVVVASIVLVVLSPTTEATISTAVFGLTSVLLFGTSAVYHRGTWSPRVTGVLRRIDHSNIFLIIAGSYTPLSVLLLPPSTARLLLAIVWTGAVLGLLGRVLWLGAPRWLYTPIYVVLGSVALGFLPQFAESGGLGVVWLVVGGGVAYIAGAVVYGIKRPNPSPRWFGFHEVFHALTVVGFTSHYVAVSIASYGSA
ncbi:hemolysin III family protein [Cellulomonas fimi]|uniref:Hemolysin III family protein n=1 Tax=Cellulomonas fimi TaxID=1708 RepID=A0A7Y0LYQ1_CELFI|nr:hemolysin III family protein [Cellulomonas fimi]NMR19843.1 hemolysin III family protein [Cellulomonas fimi]